MATGLWKEKLWTQINCRPGEGVALPIYSEYTSME